MSRGTKLKLNTFSIITIFIAILFSFPKNVSADIESEDEPVFSIGKPGPIYAETKIVNGKPACNKGGDNPSPSNKKKPGHIDGECCLDPDETPNSNCYYSPSKYGDLIEEYLEDNED